MGRLGWGCFWFGHARSLNLVTLSDNDRDELKRLQVALAELEARLYDDLATVRMAHTHVAGMLRHRVELFPPARELDGTALHK